jgi:hypothetical protein
MMVLYSTLSETMRRPRKSRTKPSNSFSDIMEEQLGNNGDNGSKFRNRPNNINAMAIYQQITTALGRLSFQQFPNNKPPRRPFIENVLPQTHCLFVQPLWVGRRNSRLRHPEILPQWLKESRVRDNVVTSFAFHQSPEKLQGLCSQAGENRCDRVHSERETEGTERDRCTTSENRGRRGEGRGERNRLGC